MSEIEALTAHGQVLGYVIRAGATAAQTSFFTQDDANLQGGFVVYPRGGEVTPHIHLPVQRQLVGTAEFLQVRSGRCSVDVYTPERELIATHELGPGDAILTLIGGHGFRMLEDTVLLELKQGPFLPEQDKQRFVRHPSRPEP